MWRGSMSDLMFISETGMFHSACRVGFGPSAHWFGFKPLEHRSPKGPGMVDKSDRSAFINHSITFDVNDAILQAAAARVAADYANKIYVVTVCDCVSFTADIARQCRLRVPAVNILPYGFIQTLALWNSYKSKN